MNSCSTPQAMKNCTGSLILNLFSILHNLVSKNKNSPSQFVASPFVVIIYRSCFLLFYHPIYLDYCNPLKMKIAYRVLIYFNSFQKIFFLTFKKTTMNSDTKTILCILPKFLLIQRRLSFQKIILTTERLIIWTRMQVDHTHKW